MNQIKLEEIIAYQEKTLNFLKLELEKEIEFDKDSTNDKNAIAKEL